MTTVRMLMRSVLATVAVAGMVAACGAGDTGDPGPGQTTTPGPGQTAAAGSGVRCVVVLPPTPYASREFPEPGAPELRRELLELQDADQAERSGEVAANNDAARAARLREIIDEHGWPAPDLVGVDGTFAAWLIAQHADFDVEFQREVLDLMCAAVAVGDADPTDLAYLEDRVAVNSGRSQVYGTQFGGCENGRPVPAPLADDEAVHRLREQVGLQPLDEYLALFEAECAAESPAS